jgi:hypothetical protein
VSDGADRETNLGRAPAPDYTSVLAEGDRVVAAEYAMRQFTRTDLAPESRAATAMSNPLATYAFHLGAASIATSLDHLRTVAQIVQTAVIPAFSLISLLRTGHECALVGQWLLDPSISENTRIARGVGAQARDLKERKNFEKSIDRPEPTVGRLAIDRLSMLLNEAVEQGFAKPDTNGRLVPVAPLPSAIELFDQLEVTPTSPGSWLYRYYSGFAHGKQWAIALGAERQGSSDQHGHAVARVASNDHVMIWMMQRATSAAIQAADWYSELRGTDQMT